MNKLNKVFSTRINEATERECKQLRSSEILPQTFDVTVEGWLARVTNWGKPNYYYQKPKTRMMSGLGGRKKVTKKFFIDQIVNGDLNRMFGKWKLIQKAQNKMYAEREFVDIDGKRKIERTFLEIDLKPELRR